MSELPHGYDNCYKLQKISLYTKH